MKKMLCCSTVFVFFISFGFSAPIEGLKIKKKAFEKQLKWILAYNSSKNEDLSNDPNTNINSVGDTASGGAGDEPDMFTSLLSLDMKLNPLDIFTIDGGVGMAATGTLSQDQADEAGFGMRHMSGSFFLAKVLQKLWSKSPDGLLKFGYVKDIASALTIGKSPFQFAPISAADVQTVRNEAGGANHKNFDATFAGMSGLNKIINFDSGFPSVNLNLSKDITNGEFKLDGLFSFLDLNTTVGDQPNRYWQVSGKFQYDIAKFLSLGINAINFNKRINDAAGLYGAKHLRGGLSATIDDIIPGKALLYSQYDWTYGGSVGGDGVSKEWDGKGYMALAMYEGPFFGILDKFKFGGVWLASLDNNLITKPEGQVQNTTSAPAISQFIYPSLLKDWLEGRVVTDTDPGPTNNNDYQWTSFMGFGWKDFALEGYFHRMKFDEVGGGRSLFGPKSYSVKFGWRAHEHLALGFQYDKMDIENDSALAAEGAAANAMQWRALAEFVL